SFPYSATAGIRHCPLTKKVQRCRGHNTQWTLSSITKSSTTYWRQVIPLVRINAFKRTESTNRTVCYLDVVGGSNVICIFAYAFICNQSTNRQHGQQCDHHQQFKQGEAFLFCL